MNVSDKEIKEFLENIRVYKVKELMPGTSVYIKETVQNFINLYELYIEELKDQLREKSEIIKTLGYNSFNLVKCKKCEGLGKIYCSDEYKLRLSDDWFPAPRDCPECKGLGTVEDKK